MINYVDKKTLHYEMLNSRGEILFRGYVLANRYEDGLYLNLNQWQRIFRLATKNGAYGIRFKTPEAVYYKAPHQYRVLQLEQEIFDVVKKYIHMADEDCPLHLFVRYSRVQKSQQEV